MIKNAIELIVVGAVVVSVFLGVVIGFENLVRWYGDRSEILKYEPKD